MRPAGLEHAARGPRRGQQAPVLKPTRFTSRSLVRGLVWLTATAFLLAACGETGSEPRSAAPPPSDRPTHNTPSPPGAPVRRDGASRVAPRRGLVDVRPVPFERVRLDEGGRALTVFYYGGVEACYGLDRVDVALAPRTVAVTVYEGRVPGAQVCAEVLQRKATTVRLREPVAGRRIVDGARHK